MMIMHDDDDDERWQNDNLDEDIIRLYNKTNMHYIPAMWTVVVIVHSVPIDENPAFGCNMK